MAACELNSDGCERRLKVFRPKHDHYVLLQERDVPFESQYFNKAMLHLMGPRVTRLLGGGGGKMGNFPSQNSFAFLIV